MSIVFTSFKHLSLPISIKIPINIPQIAKLDNANLVVAWLCYNYFRFFQLCKGDLNCRKLHILHPVWFELFLPTLVELDISGNYLTELPDCVPWKLQNLRVFRAASNTLKHLSTPDLTYSNNELCPR